MVEGLGALLCAKNGPPKGTRMSQKQLRASLAETSVKNFHSLRGHCVGLSSNLSSELAPHPTISVD